MTWTLDLDPDHYRRKGTVISRPSGLHPLVPSQHAERFQARDLVLPEDPRSVVDVIAGIFERHPWLGYVAIAVVAAACALIAVGAGGWAS